MVTAQRFQLEGLISDESGELPAEDTYSPGVNYSNDKNTLSKTETVDQSNKIPQKSVKEQIKITSEENQSVEDLDEKLEENQSVEDLDEKLEENLSRVDGTKDGSV